MQYSYTGHVVTHIIAEKVTYLVRALCTVQRFIMFHFFMLTDNTLLYINYKIL